MNQKEIKMEIVFIGLIVIANFPLVIAILFLINFFTSEK